MRRTPLLLTLVQNSLAVCESALRKASIGMSAPRAAKQVTRRMALHHFEFDPLACRIQLRNPEAPDLPGASFFALRLAAATLAALPLRL